MNTTPLSKLGSLSILFIASLTIMVGTVVAPGLMSISKNLGVPNYATWLMTIPSLGVVIISFFSSRFIEKFGYYKAMIVGLIFYGFFGVIGMFLHGFLLVFLDRFLLGAMTGIILVSVNGLISEFFQGKQRLKMIALQAIAIELGGVLILGTSGVLSTIHWNYPFLIYLFAWIFLVFLLLFIPNPNKKASNKENEEEFTNIKSSIKEVLLYVVSSMFLFFIGIIVLPTYLPFYDMAEDEMGYLLAFISFIAIIAAGTIPKLTSKLKERNVLIIAFSFYMISHFIFFSTSNTIFFIIAGVFHGSAFGLTIPLLNHMTIERSSSKKLSKNLALYTMMVFLGQFLSSFMEFIPVSRTYIFLITSIFALVIVIYSIFRLKKFS